MPDGIYVLFQSGKDGARGSIPHPGEIGLLVFQIEGVKKDLRTRGDVFVDTGNQEEAMEWINDNGNPAKEKM